MNENNKRITVTDVENITYQADKIAGLASVFSIYLDFMDNYNDLNESLKCLLDEARQMQENCYMLLDKFCSGRKKDITKCYNPV